MVKLHSLTYPSKVFTPLGLEIGKGYISYYDPVIMPTPQNCVSLGLTKLNLT